MRKTMVIDGPYGRKEMEYVAGQAET